MSLTPEEKKQLAQRITRGVQVVCSSLAQLHLTSPDPNASIAADETGIIGSLRRHGANKWKFTNIEGALLLTRDRQGICHFRVYDLSEYKLRFQYELYENMHYQRLSDRCHAFEMESCVCGFSFSNEKIADKFYERVQANIVHTNQDIYANEAQANLFSPDFNQAPPVPAKVPVNNSPQVSAEPSPQFGNLYLENGLIDPNMIPGEWKKILRSAGIRKKDLKNPQMQEAIREALEEFNISLEPPPLDMDDAEIRKYYTPEQLAEYEEYKRQVEEYEAELRRYEKEMAEYEARKEKEEKLRNLVMKQEQEAANSGAGSGEERLRASVMHFQQKELASVLPAIRQEEVMMPRMSVNRPLIPALPVIPTNDAGRNSTASAKNAAKMIESRNSKMMIQPGFLSAIKKQDFQLRHVSVLPDLRKVDEGDKNGILNTLMEKIKQQRRDLGEDDDEDEDVSDFEDI